MRVPFLLQPGATETPPDYASRLAMKSRRDDVAKFCLDFGLDHQGVVDGRLEAIDELAMASGVAWGRMYEHAFRRIEEGLTYIHRDQFFTRPQLNRDRLRICPYCLAEDVEHGEGRVESRPYRRSVWMIDVVRICEIHGRTLVDLPDVGSIGAHDTSIRIATALANMRDLVAKSVVNRPTSLEQYVRHRLQGGRTADWIDALPMYVVINVAPIIGSLEVSDDPSELQDVPEKTRVQWEEVGTNILTGGPAEVGALLDRLNRRFFTTRRQVGGRVLFGRLYERLAHETDDAGYEPIRRLIHEHLQATMPVAERDTAFGRSFDDRKVRSVRVAAQEHGLHPKRMRKVLDAAGLLKIEDDATSDHRSIFDAAAGGPLLRSLSDSLDLKSLAAYLGIPRPHERALVERGLVNALIPSSVMFRTWSIERSEADRLLARMIACADPDRPATGLHPLPKAASRSCRSSGEILELLLDGRLCNVGLDPDARGYMAVLVDPDEIKQITAPRVQEITTLREAERHLSTSTKVIKALIARGHLEARTVLNPVMRREQTVIDKTEISRFQREYVSLQSLSEERNLHFRQVSTDLRSKGVKPIDDPSLLNATIFRRSDIV
ncbi:TniQ family protein [Aureimonas ureilytica]|uniref:TniQ family protein n=1 Tax=Aureimonas ureilytica TaxID=401562 RepID=UPI0009E76C07|nr:TniQ family protein [Aureimonas ureilytica]